MSKREEKNATPNGAGSGMPELVSFSLDDQRYALFLSSVERIVRIIEVTPLPRAPEIALGVINMHGQIIPVREKGFKFDA